MEIRGTQNIQDELEKEEQSWRTHGLQFPVLLQNYGHQENLAGA